MHFTEPTYYREEFISLSISGESLHGVTFDECSFADCNLVECSFDRCAFVDCRFRESAISNVNAVNSRFLRPQFSGCKIMGFDWSKTAKLQDLSFTECQIDYSNFSSLVLRNTTMIRCSAKEVRFVETDLSDSVFTDSDFQASTFFKANLSRADFRGARNYEIDVGNNVIKGARFSLPEVLSLLYSLGIEID